MGVRAGHTSSGRQLKQFWELFLGFSVCSCSQASWSVVAAETQDLGHASVEAAAGSKSLASRAAQQWTWRCGASVVQILGCLHCQGTMEIGEYAFSCLPVQSQLQPCFAALPAAKPVPETG